ncbi:MAG TPA: HAMP domain-containing protein, partial [Longimicrobium sp.]|nr:HAMP domain-containing protein [Longimicrobium sp.]
MRLRERIVTTLLAITVVLAVPSAYGLVQLGALNRIADELRTRDTRATETVGKLRTSLEELQAAEDNYVVLRNEYFDDAVGFQREAQTAMGEAATHLDSLRTRASASPRYRQAVAAAAAQWRVLRTVVGQEQKQEGQDTAYERKFRDQQVKPAFARMTRLVPPITRAIEAESQERVGRAAELAETARNTVLAALTVALALTLVLGLLLTRALLRPIGELRRGMAHVAEGDFEPAVRVPVQRQDELGDLSRSFTTMTAQLAELDRLKAEFVS